MIDLNSEFSLFKSIICLNGEIPTRDYFARYAHLPLLAADGAANALIEMGIEPEVIIGDLDSIELQTIPKHIEIIQVRDQNSTDLQKVLAVLADRDLLPCLIYGATGKELDHSLYNLSVIAEYSQDHRIIFHDSAYKDQDKYGIFICKHFHANLEIGSKLSVLAYTPSKVSTSGLVWDLHDTDISAQCSSIRNIVREQRVEIMVHTGCILVYFQL